MVYQNCLRVVFCMLNVLFHFALLCPHVTSAHSWPLCSQLKASTSFLLVSQVPCRNGLVCGLSVGWLATSSWTEEFVQRYEMHGLAILNDLEAFFWLGAAWIKSWAERPSVSVLNDLEADWIQRATEYGLQRLTLAGRILRSTYLMRSCGALLCIGRIQGTIGVKRAGGSIQKTTPGRHRACRT